MSYIGVPPQTTFSSGLLDRFTSTTGTTVTLTNDIASENDIVVFVNFVKQDSTTYSVGGTGNKTLTLGGTLVSSDIVEVHYLNIVGQTNAPSSGSVGSSQLTSGAVTGAKLNTDVISAQTELATAPASTDELLISDAGVLKRVDVSLVGGDNTPSFLATTTGSQSIPNNSFTKIQFTVEEYDNGGVYDHSSNYRFTPAETGKYIIYGGVGIESINGSKYFTLRIYKNGSAFTTPVASHTATTGDQRFNFIFGINNTSSSDYYEVYIFHNHGSSRDANDCRFGAHKLIGV